MKLITAKSPIRPMRGRKEKKSRVGLVRTGLMTIRWLKRSRKTNSNGRVDRGAISP
jgi:hypothetical protein